MHDPRRALALRFDAPHNEREGDDHTHLVRIHVLVECVRQRAGRVPFARHARAQRLAGDCVARTPQRSDGEVRTMSISM